MRVKDVIGLVLGLIIIRLLLPTSEIHKFWLNKWGEIVKVKWIDGSVSKLKKGVWIHES